MNIAILELYRGPAGEKGFYNRQEVGLGRAYAALGHKVLIVYPRKGLAAPQTETAAPGVTVRYQPARGVGVHGVYPLDFLLQEHIELVHLDADNQLFAPRVEAFCRRHGIRLYNYIGVLHSDTANPLKRAATDLLAGPRLRMLRRTPTFAKTAAVQGQLRAAGVRAPVVPVGLDLAVIPEVPQSGPELRAALGLPQDKHILLFIGRLEPYKRPLDALTLLAGLDDSYLLLMLGEGSLRAQLEQQAAARGLAGRLRLLGQRPNTEIHAFAKAADCLVNFNDREIFGMAMLEAMYQGCPVAARRAAGPAAIVAEGETGYLCDDPAQMPPLVTKAAAQHDAMGAAARRRVLEHFSWDHAARAFLAGAK